MDLTLPMKGIYFDQINAGEKWLEYRLRTPYWTKRLKSREYRNIVLTRGYPKGGGVEGETRLTRRWRGYLELTLEHEHFGQGHVEVYAINVAMPPTTALKDTTP